MTDQKKPSGPCPCGSRKAYALCCWRLHSGEAAPDAEALMRSRYAAYVMKRPEYILATWHTSTRPPASETDLTGMPRWLGLKVLRHEMTGENSAIVEFTAKCRKGGQLMNLHELSRFVREDGRWYYLDGDLTGA